MCKKPVNSLNLEMLTELTTALDTLQSNRQCSALIITSVCACCLVLLYESSYVVNVKRIQ